MHNKQQKSICYDFLHRVVCSFLQKYCMIWFWLHMTPIMRERGERERVGVTQWNPLTGRHSSSVLGTLCTPVVYNVPAWLGVTLVVASVSLISDTDKLTGCVRSAVGPGDRLGWTVRPTGDTRPTWMCAGEGVLLIVETLKINTQLLKQFSCYQYFNRQMLYIASSCFFSHCSTNISV